MSIKIREWKDNRNGWLFTHDRVTLKIDKLVLHRFVVSRGPYVYFAITKGNFDSCLSSFQKHHAVLYEQVFEPIIDNFIEMDYHVIKMFP